MVSENARGIWKLNRKANAKYHANTTETVS